MIDHKLIRELEGFSLTGYVPKAPGDKSGVTIATGVDLGHMPAVELERFPEALAARLRRYLGKRGTYAREELAVHPLTVTQQEADLLDTVVQERIASELKAKFRAGSGKDFDAQTDAFQTVVYSVSHHYGTPWVRCPNFWKKVIAVDVPGMIWHLENFGDKFPTRRRKEAAYLRKALGSAAA